MCERRLRVYAIGFHEAATSQAQTHSLECSHVTRQAQTCTGLAQAQVNPFDVKTTPIIPAGQTLRPLRDQLLVEPLDWQPSTLIEVVRLGRPVRGVVKAAGPGAYQRKRWTDTQGRKWVKDTDRFIPTQVKPGDVIELGGLNAFDGEGYRFEDDVIFEGKWHFWCTEKDVAMVHDA